MKSTYLSLQIPIKSKVINDDQSIGNPWLEFFRQLKELVDGLGQEKFATIENNIGTPTDVEGFAFSKKNVGHAIIDYLIQRVTTDVGATELVEAGTFGVYYRPSSDDFVLQYGPSSAGVTLTVTASGQVQYVTSDITGTPWISKITYRARTLGAKNQAYSGAV